MAYKTRILMRNAIGEEYEITSFQNCKVARNITDMSSTFSFALDSFDLEEVADKFTIGTEVNIWQGTEEDMVHTISGWINQEPRKLEGLIKTIEFAGVDFGGRLQYRIITEAFMETDIGEIVARLMQKYAPEFPTDIRTTGMIITAKYDKLFLFDVLKELAGIVDYDCYVDLNKTFKFVPAGFEGDGRTQKIIKTNEFKKGSANFTKDASRLVNRLLVAGGNITSKETRELYKYTASMNNFIETKRRPVGTPRRHDPTDYRAEFVFKSNYDTETRGKYTTEDITTSAYYSGVKCMKPGVFKYSNPILDDKGLNSEGTYDISELTWEATLSNYVFGKSNPDTVFPFFLEKNGAINYAGSQGLGVYYLNNQFRFFISTSNLKAVIREELIVPEELIWTAGRTTPTIACRLYEKTMEVWVEGELIASKELAEKPVFASLNSNNTEMHLAPSYGFYVWDSRLSFVKRNEAEMYAYSHTSEPQTKVWVYLNDLQLRTATENLQETDGYDVMINYNAQTLDFGEHLALKEGDKIEIIYAYEYIIMDVVENTSSQKKYGLFEDKLVLASNNREYVKAQANKHVQKYSKPVLVGSIEPFDFHYTAGEMITVDIPELYIFERDVKITAVEYSSSPNQLSCKLTLESAANVSQLFANIIKRVEFLEAEKFYNEDEELKQLEKYIETVKITDKISIEDLEASGFVFDKAKFNRSEFSGKALG